MRFEVQEYSVAPEVLQTFQLMMIGFTTINLLFLLVTTIVVKLFKIRVCFSSIVASINLSWISIGVVGVVYGEAVQSPLVGGFGMLISVAIYTGYLYLMQPDTLQILAKKELRKNELLKKELEKKKLRKDISVINKSTESSQLKKQKIQDINDRLKELEFEKSLVKQAYKKVNPLDRFFKKKVQKVIEKQ